MSLSSAAAKASFRYHLSPSILANNQNQNNRRGSTFTSLSNSTNEEETEEEESYARTDYGLESPTIVSHLIETVRKESKIMTNIPHDIPPPLGFDEFQTLSSTKQNIELFKILNAISEEIEVLRQSTEHRFSALETMLQYNKANLYGLLPVSATDKSVKSRDLKEESAESRHRSNGSDRSSGTTTRPASWPKDNRDNEESMDLLLAKNLSQDRLVRLNIGGTIFEVSWSLLDKLPQTRLGRLSKCRSEEEILELADGYDPEKNEFYFNRQPRNFNCILNFLTTGKLHLGEETCVIAFSQDLEYWEVDELYLEQCCVQKYYQQRELLTWDYQGNKKEDELEIFRPGRLGRLQKLLWELFERPHTSLGARVVALISITFIVLSTVVLTLNTLPYFDKRDENNNERDYPPFALLEAIYMSWFTFEFLIRLISCPSKVKFIKSPMNVIDLLAILPYYVSIALVNSTSVGQLTEVRRIAQFFRIMRILRIFKLARHSVGLQSLGFTIRNSYKELGLLMLFMTISVLIFASLVYVFEKDESNTTFNDMLDSYWWALITMTTVGYGDISPKTMFGKLIGSMCAICGVLVIALPIPIIGNNFAAFYKNERRREQLSEKKAALERARRKGAITPFPGQINLRNGSNPEEGGLSPTNSERGKNIDITELDAETLADVTRYSSRRSISVMNGINVSGGADGPLPNVSIK